MPWFRYPRRHYRNIEGLINESRCIMHSFFSNSSGMKKSACSIYLCAPISLMSPMYVFSYNRARINFLCQSNTVFSLVRQIIWLLRTNQSTILLWRRKYIPAHTKLYSYWLDWSCDCWEQIRVQYCCDVESVFLL